MEICRVGARRALNGLMSSAGLQACRVPTGLKPRTTTAAAWLCAAQAATTIILGAAQQSRPGQADAVSVRLVQGRVSVLSLPNAGGPDGANVTAQIGADGVLLVDTLSADAAPRIL